MIQMVIVYCLVLNPTMCKVMPYEAAGRELTSVSDCLMSGAIASMKIEGAEYFAKIRCRQVDNASDGFGSLTSVEAQP